LMIGINFATMILFPDGLFYTPMQLWDNWFIGYRNMFIFYFAPALALELLKKNAGGSPVRYYVMLTICTLSMVLGGSKTGLLCMLAFLALILTGLYRKKLCNILTITVVSLGAFVSIVLLGLQRYLTPIFEMLGRNVTFTNRVFIWEKVIEYIKQSPMIGHGIPSEQVRTEMLDIWTAVTAHNFILEVLFCFGLAGLVLTAIWMSVSVYQLYRHRKHPFAAAMCLGMVCFHLLMLMEGELNNVPMYSFFFLTCCMDQFVDQMPAKQEERTKKT